MHAIRERTPALHAPAAATIAAESLGSPEFRRDYGLRYAYLAGAMYKGIASRELVVAMGRAGMMGFLGTGGMELAEVEAAIDFIQTRLSPAGPYGMNLLSNFDRPELVDRTVDLYMARGVRNVEASAFTRVTPSLVYWRAKGLTRGADGAVEPPRRVIAKVSRPEVAEAFMRPAPADIVAGLRAAGRISVLEAELSQTIPMADDVCVEADSGGHTDQGVAFALLPTISRQRDDMMARYRYRKRIRLGAAGGIGTPDAAAASFVIGTDFILTGSINQCTVEAGTSDAVKDLLQELNVQDTDYAPAGDMFEMGARVQVATRGLFFASRANKLYELYQRHGSIEEIDAATRQQIQDRYFKRSFEDVWAETRAHYERELPGKIEEIEKKPKQKMALIFRWYFVHTTRLALSGEERQRVDYQIHCGPALGAFNQWVKGTELQNWRNRRVAEIGVKIMTEAAEVLDRGYRALQGLQSFRLPAAVPVGASATA